MIEMFRTVDVEEIKKIVFTKELTKAYNHDILLDAETFSLSLDMMYFLLVEDGNILGFCSLKEISTRTVECHLGLLPQHWGTGKSNDFIQCIQNTAIKKTQYRNIITYVPECCQPALKAALRNGGKITGKVPEGTTDHGTPCDLYLINFSLESNEL